MADFVAREKIQDVISDIYKDADSAVEGACIEIWSRVKEIPAADVRSVVLCKDCRHRDPEDHKCDSGERERQGCPFKVADDYFCAYGEK